MKKPNFQAESWVFGLGIMFKFDRIPWEHFKGVHLVCIHIFRGVQPPF